MLKPVIAEEAKKRQGERTDLSNIPQKSAGSETRDELAKIAGPFLSARDFFDAVPGQRVVL